MSFEAGVIGCSLHPLRAAAQASNSYVFATLDSCLVRYDSAHIEPVVLRHSPFTHLCYSYSMHVQAKLEVWGDQIKVEGSCFLIAANSSLGHKIWQTQRCLFCPFTLFISSRRPDVGSSLPPLPFFFPCHSSEISEFNFHFWEDFPCLVAVIVYKAFVKC